MADGRHFENPKDLNNGLTEQHDIWFGETYCPNELYHFRPCTTIHRFT